MVTATGATVPASGLNIQRDERARLAYLRERLGVRDQEVQDSTAVIAKNSTGGLCRVWSEAAAIADIAPKPSYKNLQPAILKVLSCSSILEANGALQLCTSALLINLLSHEATKNRDTATLHCRMYWQLQAACTG